MSNLATNDKNTMMDRTPDRLSFEINVIKNQTRDMLLNSSIQIGERLIEAKMQIEHGEWEEWLKTNVDYSIRTAQNLMRIAREYRGHKAFPIGDNSNTQTSSFLNISQAIELLKLPSDEREEFMNDNDILEMTTKELQKAIKEKEEWIKALDAAEKELKEAEAVAAELRDESRKFKELGSHNLELSQHLDKKTKEILKLNNKINKLQEKTIEIKKVATEEEAAKIKDEISGGYEKEIASMETDKDLAEKRANALEIRLNNQNNGAAFKHELFVKETVKSFGEVCSALVELRESNPQVYEKRLNATQGLVSAIQKKLNQIKD